MWRWMAMVLAAWVWVVGSAVAAPADAEGAFRDYRAIWISRFEFSNEAGIRDRIAAIADAGFTEVMFQVRGQGDVLFPSAVETWDAGKYGSNGPGFDPLGVAVQEAHDHGLKLHAWINAVPMWRDSSNPHLPPADPNHFYNAHPELRLKDVNGNDMPLSSGQYVGVNPTHPGTVTHITDLAREMVQNYDLDGVHLDYIRMVTNGASGPLTYPQDPDTRARFNSETGLNASSSPNEYKQWVGDKITTLVTSVRDTVAAEDPDAQLSAAVWRDYDIGTADYQQRADEWVEDAAVDFALPMIYTTNDSLYRNNFLKWKSLDADAGVAAGLGSYLHSGSQQTLDQLDTAQYLGANGFTLFSYGTLFNGTTLNAFGQAVKDYNAELVARDDDLLPLGDFEGGDEGYFASSPLLSGSNFGINAGTTAGITGDAAFDGVSSQEIFIDGDEAGWFLRHLAGTAGGAASPSGNQELIAQGSIGFWLRTLDEDLTVRLAVDDVEGTAERGTLKDVVADGQWHLYEWGLEDDSQWEGWVNGNGQINGQTITLDSIQFFGSGDATVYLDKVAFNPFGSLDLSFGPSLVGDFNADGFVSQADLDLVLLNWGDGVVPAGFDEAALTSGGPFDGLISQNELDAVLLHWGDGTPSAASAIPEPGALAVLALAGLLPAVRRPRRAR